MRRFREQSKFEIQPVIEQKPFENPAVQNFFAKWCEINDSIRPQMIRRDEWEKRGIKGALEKQADGKQKLFIPDDLHLWEMVGVMEAVDQDTFSSKPERRTEAKEKLSELAKIFQNSGTYIAQRLDGITEGQDIAKALALEFYEYGQSLAEGKRPEMALGIDDIALRNLASEEVEAVDHFLAGDTLYESRQKRAEQAIAKDSSKEEELYEAERQKTLAQFFRVAEKAFMLEDKSTDEELQENVTQQKVWQDNLPVHGAFLARIEKAMMQKIETPKRELETAIFRRGLEKLTNEMKESGWKQAVNSFFEKIGFNLRIKQEKLFSVLNISELKDELEVIRSTGESEEISQKECEIADKIQNAVSSFPYKSEANNPSEMVATQYINCVGASALGGALMKEVGLDYLVGSVPGHSILLLITSDGQVEWRDMQNPSLNDRLADEAIKGHKKDGTPIRVQDIAAFSHNPSPEGLTFNINKGIKYKKNLFRRIKKDRRLSVTVFEPEYGQQIQVLNNTGCALEEVGLREEAIEAYRQAAALDPKDTVLYGNLGNTLRSLGRNKEAVEAYQRAVAIDTKNAQAYNSLGLAFQSLGRNKEAVEAYQQVVALHPKDASIHYNLGNALRFLGRNKEAVEAYKKFISLSDKKKNADIIEGAEQIIAELEFALI